MRQWIERILVLCAVLLATGLPADAARVKDISDIYGVRDNNLLGYGLVTGLQRTGDTMRNQATIQTVAKRLQGLGVTLTPDQIRSRNVAVVMVTARLPSSARPGQRIDVTVSSAGDAISLQGGVLQLTQLVGAKWRSVCRCARTVVYRWLFDASGWCSLTKEPLNGRYCADGGNS